MAKSRRVAIVAGLRTPFANPGTAYAQLSALELGRLVVSELLERVGIARAEIQTLVFGQALPSIAAPNIAREIVLGIGLPRTVDAYTVSRACISGYQSALSVALAIESGEIDLGIAGGCDSLSEWAKTVRGFRPEGMRDARRGRSLVDRVRVLSDLRIQNFAQTLPILRELSTGLTMGESAEQMAKLNGISREHQDAFAHRSHLLAARAWADGKFSEEVMTAYLPPEYGAFHEDNLVRKDSELLDYARFEPAFDRAYGSITEATSSPWTDGASALLLASQEKAQSLGLEVLGFVKSHAFCAVDPFDQLLVGPAYAIPLALDRAGLKLKHMDLVDLHEAFAAQVLCNTQALESDKFAREKLGRDKRVGVVDWERFNVNGGSIAVGHPFAATGARQITQTLRELRRQGGQYALAAACASGGLGGAIVLEAAP